MPKINEIRREKELGYKNSCCIKRVWAACIDCGKQRWVRLNVSKGIPRNLRCPSCASRLKPHPWGDKSCRWNGGKITDSKGYVMVKLQTDDFFYPMAESNGYVFEHRLVMAKHLGRCLQPWEHVHHKDGIKSHNEYSNLKLTTAGSHSIEHSKGYRDGYRKGLIDGRTKQIEGLRQEIRLLRWQIKEGANL